MAWLQTTTLIQILLATTMGFGELMAFNERTFDGLGL